MSGRNLLLLMSALKLWRHRRLQALLSSLGIVAGVSGLVLVIALGQGAKRELSAALGTLGAGSIVVQRPDGQDDRPAFEVSRANAVIRLLADWVGRAALVSIQQHDVVTPEGRMEAARIVGTDRAYQRIFRLDLHGGRFIGELDLFRLSRVCVLGWDAGKVLFPRGQVLGQDLRIGGDVYKVVGWLRPSAYRLPKLESLGLSETDHVIYTPVTTLHGRTEGYPLDQLVLQFSDEATMTAALASVQRIAGFGKESNALEYVVPIELLRQKQRMQQILQYLLLGIASLMLVVGGVGIMNMMMVNVISRRAEIGLRRAIGATPRDIVTQFVIESSVIAVVGGFMGMALGYMVSLAVDAGTRWPMEFSISAAAIGFATSVAVGVVFGGYPALQAASVSPVQALHEL